MKWHKHGTKYLPVLIMHKKLQFTD